MCGATDGSFDQVYYPGGVLIVQPAGLFVQVVNIDLIILNIGGFG